MIVDFHSHTRESDGSLAPAELAALVRRRGVRWWSITDHDTTRAYEGLDALGVRVVRGIEINTTVDGNDVHILGYGLPATPSPLDAVLAANRDHRRRRIETMVGGLREAGYPLTVDDVHAESGGGHALGRPHVAKALIRRGLVRDVEHAFRELLAPGGPGYAPSQHITPDAAIAAIAGVGGIPVLAHPGRLRDLGLLDALAPRGLRGLEVFYPRHDRQLVALLRTKAARYGLVMTGGSDFHDARHGAGTVGMEIDEADVRPFLDLVAA